MACEILTDVLQILVPRLFVPLNLRVTLVTLYQGPPTPGDSIPAASLRRPCGLLAASSRRKVVWRDPRRTQLGLILAATKEKNRTLQSRRPERPRSSRDHHSKPLGAICRSSTSTFSAGVTLKWHISGIPALPETRGDRRTPRIPPPTLLIGGQPPRGAPQGDLPPHY